MSKPILKWAGGKRRLVPFIQQHLPKPTGRLIEPFCGSAALSLATEYDAYWLNDINVDLMTLYQAILEHGDDFLGYAKSYFTAENNTQKAYLAHRETFNHTSVSDNAQLKAALFLYLNRHGFNGLCRYNRSGGFNVPFGKYNHPYFPESEIRGLIDKAPRITLSCLSFEQVFEQASGDDVIYCDPPYLPIAKDKACFVGYVAGGFDEQQQHLLANLAEQRQQDKVGYVAISNHDSDQIKTLYRAAVLHAVDVRRSIAGRGDSRKKVGEILAIF